MRTKKWFAAGLSASVLATVAFVGCSPANPGGQPAKQEEQVLNLAMGDEIPTMDISKATDTYAFTIMANTNEGLVRLDKDGKAAAALAKDWDISPDGLTYTFHLRDGIKWANGDPITASDFEYSWKRTLNPETAAQYAFMVAWVKGGAAYNSGKGSADQVGVKAVNDKTLQVQLENPLPFFIEQMAFPIFYPQQQKFVEAQGARYGADASTTLANGPFKMTSWEHEQSTVLVKNESYWDAEKVKLQQVNIQVIKDTNAALNLYEAGQLDRTGLVRDMVDSYKNNPDYSVQPELTTGYLSYNQRVTALQNTKVRQALTWAIDADSYADIVYHNGTVGATGYTPLGVTDGLGGDFAKNAGDLIQRKENLAKAKQTLQEGLAEMGLTDFPKIKLLSDDGDVGKKSSEFIQEQWRKNLGINIEIETVPFKLRLQRSDNHDYDIVFALWGADYNDPMTFLDMNITDGDFNYGQWSNKQYDELISKAQVEPDKNKRMTYLLDAEKLMMKEMPIGPVFFRARAFVTKPYVKNFLWRSFGPDYEFKETYIEGKN